MPVPRAVRALLGPCLCGLLLSCGGSATPARHRSRARSRHRPAAASPARAPTGGSTTTASAPGHPPGTTTTITSTSDSEVAATTTGTTTATTTTRTTPARPPRPSPGSLPQTAALPSAGTRAFHAEMRALWRGIVGDSVKAAMPAFFPEGAYAQLKAIGDPQADFEYRLVYDYQLDLASAHALLGAGAASAQLISVEVPSSYAHWVPNGVCENSVGYYEVPNARVVYEEGGEERSFGIASMISWRGVWYVIHLGEVLRPVVEGAVDDPATGPGVAADSGTC